MSNDAAMSDQKKKFPRRKPQSVAEVRLVTAAWAASVIVPLLVAVILALHWRWALISDDPANFARAGAAMIVVDILAYGIFRWEADAVLGIAYFEGRRLWRIEVFFGFVTAITGVLGTATWGYGDIFFKFFS